ncbi:YwdI family protein [Neobacillus rhizophilus]|uniref:YwdI family protein n=1 Tax=Neobacillus rhizophilus TaxID=2833579 RepID=A0A942YV14_9BACI|nr:YwdI family protein [Neobacillus rhizophilus]MBS4212535.1 YwdI family protein [Neobacillus rhizophilus]
MNISVQKLLAKMEEELNQARASHKEESLRERVYSIKILCELILEEKQTGRDVQPATAPIQQATTAQVFQPAAFQPAVQQPIFQQPASLTQPKKLELDDEANGDSLFDF